MSEPSGHQETDVPRRYYWAPQTQHSIRAFIKWIPAFVTAIYLANLTPVVFAPTDDGSDRTVIVWIVIVFCLMLFAFLHVIIFCTRYVLPEYSYTLDFKQLVIAVSEVRLGALTLESIDSIRIGSMQNQEALRVHIRTRNRRHYIILTLEDMSDFLSELDAKSPVKPTYLDKELSALTMFQWVVLLSVVIFSVGASLARIVWVFI